MLPKKGAAPKFNRSPMRPRMWSPIRSPTTIRGSTPRSTGTRRSRSANISGTSASASPKRWTPRSAAWGSTGTARKELIRRALEAAKARPGVKIACGVGTDHLDAERARHASTTSSAPTRSRSRAIEAMGGRLIVMASRALARAAQSPEDYARVYGRILRQVKQPVIIHWLGEMFDPALAGYWGAADHMAAMETCLGDPAGARRQDRRHQDFAAVEGEGDRHAPPPARRACACIPATTSTTRS